MPRTARIVIPGVPHHATHRGNNQQDIFFSVDDRATYLDLLKRHSGRFGLRVLGYCLMTNHVHLVVTPATEESLARTIGKAHGHFAQHINRIRGATGHLWESRFYSCPLDENHFWHALRYVERNPVRAKLVDHAWEYGWSSANAHISGKDVWDLLDLAEWRRLVEEAGVDWKAMLDEPEDERTLGALRQHTRSGEPLGSRGQAPGFALGG